MNILALLFACRTPPEPQGDVPIEPYDPVAWVDPFIGTDGLGAQVASVSPGASRPFGMVLVGPDTASSRTAAPGFYHCAGYHYADDRIMGFSHTHAHGMGVTDYGAIQVMPRDGWDPVAIDRLARALPFDHDAEWARPGSYGVELDGGPSAGGMAVEIAATMRGAAHTYTFAEGADPVLILDLDFALGDDAVSEARARVEGDAIFGFQRLQGSYSRRFGGLQTSFAGRFDPAPVSGGHWDGDTVGEGMQVDGEDVGLWLRFPEGTTTVELDLAVSYVDEAGAVGNLEAELPRFDRARVQAEAEEAWRAELSNVRVRGPDDRMRMFHTAQYHAMLMPSVISDVDGRYRGADDQTHVVDQGEHYSDFSLWDTFRTQHPWLILTRPERQTDMVRSLLRFETDGGSLPRWPLAHGYTGGMVGTPAVQVLGESVLKGLEGFDAEHAWQVSRRAALEGQPQVGRAGHDDYLELGYVSVEASGAPASRTLEYAWSDASLHRWALFRGDDADADTFATMAASWRNTFDPAQGWFTGRHRDGSFVEVRNPVIWDDSFTEGNAWHYRFGPFWDPEGLVEHTFDGDRLDALDALAAYWDAVEAEPDDLAPDDYYWHGNEPDLHYAMVAAQLGDPALTARAVNLIRDTRYEDAPTGLDGNDDAGTLSSWLLWQAIGLYPIAGTPDYVVGSPWFERVEIDGVLTVVADRVDAAPAVLRLGPDEVSGGVITHDALIGAGELRFE